MCRIMHKVKPHPCEPTCSNRIAVDAGIMLTESTVRVCLSVVYLHSFGSTGIPKLYPIDYTSANMSAKDATFWCHQQPVEKRWRCQLQTSVSMSTRLEPTSRGRERLSHICVLLHHAFTAALSFLISKPSLAIAHVWHHLCVSSSRKSKQCIRTIRNDARCYGHPRVSPPIRSRHSLC